MQNIRFFIFCIICAVVEFSCKDKGKEPAADAISIKKGVFIADGTADHFVFQNTPELRAEILVDSISAASTRYAVGKGFLTKGQNFGTHEVGDETIYILSGTGLVVIDTDTFPASVGDSYFIPEGTNHGFINKADSTMTFLWVISPIKLANDIRATKQQQ